MLRLNINQTYFAMSQWFESYFIASGDDSLGSLLGGVAVYRNDGIDELFDQGIADDWKKFYYSLGSQDHSLFEGFQAVNQFTNEYLPDVEYYTEVSRNLVYANRMICEMQVSERELHPVWKHWVASCEWIMNPNTIKVEESAFVESDRVGGFPKAEVLPPMRPAIDSSTGVKKFSEMQNYFIMIDFLNSYYKRIPDNRDLKKILNEFTLKRKTLNQKTHWYSWNAYFVDVSKKSKTVNLIQALAVVSQFMQVWVPDNALHTDFGRKLTRDIWNTIYMSTEDRQQTEIWKNWMASADKVLND
ncbi:hypothetical protein [Lactiplantibacillus herbarum]|uniref:hypothetical protein n=1 Tax=Lactiplantibacillus herbarum TaxID=1670446 RepID=UPI00069E5BEF|nr:hypothetical protein [Lactiplantibacillus herbarum]